MNVSLIPDGECQDLDEYLRVYAHDLTAYPVTRGIFCLLYSVVFCLGVTGNILVLFAVARNKSLQTVRNMFIVNLSISDILVCVLCLPASVYVNMAKTWMFGTVLCYVIPAMNGCSVIVSMFTLTCIAMDRFILVVWSGKMRPISKCCAIIMISFVWSVATALCIPIAVNSRLVPGSHYNESGEVPFCGHFCDEIGWGDRLTLKKFYGFTVLLVQFVLPLTLITICYACIIRKVRQSIVTRKAMKNKTALPTSANSRRQHIVSRLSRLFRCRSRSSSKHDTSASSTTGTRTSPYSHQQADPTSCYYPPNTTTAVAPSGAGHLTVPYTTTTGVTGVTGAGAGSVAGGGSSRTTSDYRCPSMINGAESTAALNSRTGGAQTTHSHKTDIASRRQRTNRMQTAMVLLFAASWFPFVTLNILNDFGIQTRIQESQPYLVNTIVHLISMTSTFWNPFLYAYLNTGFRKAFLDIAGILKLSNTKITLPTPRAKLTHPLLKPKHNPIAVEPDKLSAAPSFAEISSFQRPSHPDSDDRNTDAASIDNCLEPELNSDPDEEVKLRVDRKGQSVGTDWPDTDSYSLSVQINRKMSV